MKWSSIEQGSLQVGGVPFAPLLPRHPNDVICAMNAHAPLNRGQPVTVLLLTQDRLSWK